MTFLFLSAGKQVPLSSKCTCASYSQTSDLNNAIKKDKKRTAGQPEDNFFKHSLPHPQTHKKTRRII